MKNVTAILSADWHIRDTVPKCRKDDFLSAQWKKVNFIRELQNEYKCPVLCAGDLFHKWRASPHLLSQLIEKAPDDFYGVIGNHDAPYGNINLIHMSGMYTLETAGVITILPGCHYGEVPEKGFKYRIRGLEDVLVWHVMAYQEHHLPYPGVVSDTAIKLLKRYDWVKLILTGDNHTSFVERYKGRLLVNPGAITRQSADQIDYKPRVYLWDSKSNEVEEVYLPIDKDVINNDYIVNEKSRNQHLERFIQEFEKDTVISLDFKNNVRRFIEKNDIPEHLSEIVYRAMEGG